GGLVMKKIAPTFILVGLITILPLVATAQPSGTPSQPPALGSQGTVLVGSDSLVGSTVRNPNGVDLGKVSRLMIDPSDGRIVNVGVATGGPRGMGSNTISVPWNTIKVNQDSGKVVLVASQMLEPAPKVERKDSSTPPSGSQPRP